MKYLLAFFLPAILALLFAPLAIRLAEGVGMVDHPGERRVHHKPTARAGGLILFPAVLIALVAGWWGTTTFLYLAIAFSFIFLVGLWDDYRGVHYSTKFFAQTTAALAMVAGGVKVNLFGDDLLNVLLTVGWMVGIANAVNLIDGIDGLAAGLSLNALLSIGVVAALSHKADDVAVFSFILAGGVLGFLRHNISPARTFLGDSGSLVLGFSIAVMSVTRSVKSSTFLILLVPVLFIAIPLADTLLAFARRSLRGDSPFAADREHLHHALLDLQFTPTQVLAYFYTFSSLLGVLSFAFAQTLNPKTLALALVLVALMVLAIRGMQVVNLHRAVSGFNRALSQVARRMRAGEETAGRIRMMRIFFGVTAAFSLAAAAGGGDWRMILSATALVLLLALYDLLGFRVRLREHAFPWLSFCAILLLFVGQAALSLRFGAEHLRDNKGLVLSLLAFACWLGIYLVASRRLEAFVIHPLVIPAFYACGLAAGLVKHFSGGADFTPVLVVMGNTLLLYFAVVVLSRGVLSRSVALNLLGFLAVLGLTAAVWVF